MGKKGNNGSGSCCRGNDESKGTLMTELVQYTADQVMVLEKLFGECAKPSHSQRLGMICDNPALSNLDSEQIKVWFQNRRCLEKQRKEALEFQSVNDKMVATKKLLLAENKFLKKEVLQLVRENEYIRKLLQNVSAANDSAVNSDQYLSKPADTFKGFFQTAEETMKEFPLATVSGRVKEIALRTCSDLFFFPIIEILGDDSVQLSFVKIPMPLAVTGANRIYQSSRFELGGELVRFSYQIQESLLKQLCDHQDYLFSCSLEEIEPDQIPCVVPQEPPTAVVPGILPQVLNLYLVGTKEQGSFVQGYLSCK